MFSHYSGFAMLDTTVPLVRRRVPESLVSFINHKFIDNYNYLDAMIIYSTN